MRTDAGFISATRFRTAKPFRADNARAFACLCVRVVRVRDQNQSRRRESIDAEVKVATRTIATPFVVPSRVAVVFSTDGKHRLADSDGVLTARRAARKLESSARFIHRLPVVGREEPELRATRRRGRRWWINQLIDRAGRRECISLSRDGENRSLSHFLSSSSHPFTLSISRTGTNFIDGSVFSVCERTTRNKKR